ncbi:DUF2585 domain-containing protein [Labrys sp. LIt4]|uniref:UPF0314 protein C5L14_20715 n=1 Tax=Labrys okinawensis TaxID=346911 RepID=A0A2S9Q7V3_9HYPH|nr:MULTISPECIES: DUF2585 domain-containing protein [Labrys]MBP0581936.1 DUF2585 domain-containing protein [Labrys sp. LIt4]PRH85419.1 hypothetical protein C5L14_20715 [Labrys okinawensis]
MNPSSETVARSATPAPALRFWLAGAGLIALAALILFAMGRNPICTCGTVKLWVGDPNTADNSQHIADWYTLSHVIHGFLFCGLFWLLARSRPLGFRALLALVVEAGWEILENSPLIINRYREGTIALGYEGDSILNSVSDILFMLVGFLIASRLPVWATVALAIFFELLALYAIRDNLTLNVLMLIYPIASVKAWQSGL